MPENLPIDEKRAREIAASIKKLVERHQEAREISFREVQRQIGLKHPSLLRIISGETKLSGERAKWSLVKIAQYFGTNFGEAWLSQHISPVNPMWHEFDTRTVQHKKLSVNANHSTIMPVNLLLDAEVVESLEKASLEMKGVIRKEQIAASFVNTVVKKLVDEWLANRHRRVRSMRVQTADQIIHDACAAAQKEANGDE